MQIAGMPGMFALSLGNFISITTQLFTATLNGTFPHRHLIRYHQGFKKVAYIPYGMQDDDLLTDAVLRSLCVQLAIPESNFTGYLVP